MVKRTFDNNNLALKEPFISPLTGKSLTFSNEDGVFTTSDGEENFRLIANEIPDFRVASDNLNAEETSRVINHLEKLWKEADIGNTEPFTKLETVSLANKIKFLWQTWKYELSEFARYSLGRRTWTQADSMNLYKSVTDVYPNALRKQTKLFKNGELRSASLIRFKELSLEPLIDLIRKYEVRSVLDFGCGWGGNTIILKQALPDVAVWSFDYSPYRALSTRFNLQRLNLSPYRLFAADGSKLPLPDNSVDLVFTSHVLEQMNEVLMPALHEINRVARRFAVHIEPTYRFTDWAHRLRVIRKNYPRDIAKHSKMLSWKLQEYRPANPTWAPTPAEWIVLEKDGGQ